MVLQCSGCKRTDFRDQRGLSVHRAKCKEIAPHKNRPKISLVAATKKKRNQRHDNDNYNMDTDAGSSRILETEHLPAQDPQPEGSRNHDEHDDSNMDVDATSSRVFEPKPLPVQDPQPEGSRSRSGRIRHFPTSRYRDFLPAQPIPLSHAPQPLRQSKPIADSPESNPGSSGLHPEAEPTEFRTEPNDAGIFRIYPIKPTSDPDSTISLEDVCESPNFSSSNYKNPISPIGVSDQPFYAPFPNSSIFRLMSWFYNGSTMKSISNLDNLVRDVINAPDFSAQDFQNFSAAKEAKRLDERQALGSMPLSNNFTSSDGWSKSTAHLPLPCERQNLLHESKAPTVAVGDFFHRDIVNIVVSAFQDPDIFSTLHLTPYKEYQILPGRTHPTRMHSEMYSADVFYNAWEEVQNQPSPTGDSVERVMVALMLWSDSTHLTNFGTASLWPVYLSFGNQSKYIRTKPSSFAYHHLAYLPSLPDDIQDAYYAIFQKAPSSSILKHLKRELIHAVYELILNSKFMEAYKDGIPITCYDEILRRIFIRLLTYSADYPEKILLACIKFLGKFPCPRCLIMKTNIYKMGAKRDLQYRVQHARVDTPASQITLEKARGYIFKGFNVDGSKVGGVYGMDSESRTPTRNTFSTKLRACGLNVYSIFVVDFLHEFELGVWKSILTHLIRIMYAYGNSTINEFNKRFRQVPTFGRNTIRKFQNDVAAMKKLTGRDFKDILLCIMPVFEDLLPEPYNSIILDLLFELVQWLSFAKLHQMSENTLMLFEAATISLGKQVRKFMAQVCPKISTKDTPREAGARARRQASKAAGGTSKMSNFGKRTVSLKQREFNLNTYKFHALADYPATIRRFGTIDNYNTQNSEREHKRVKKFYARTNKHQFTQQCTRHERRERILQSIRAKAKAQKALNLQQASDDKTDIRLSFEQEDPLPPTSPSEHIHISESKRHRVDLRQFINARHNDPAFHDFIPRLKAHILARLLDHPFTGEDNNFTDEELQSLTIIGNDLYCHKVLRVNYTTYDGRRHQDSLNPRTHADFMTFSHETDAEDPHPFWYGRIIGIFHVRVRHHQPGPYLPETQHIRFLYVRWFGRDNLFLSGFKHKRYLRIGFDDPRYAFTFLDPDQIIRGIHLIPGFAHGKSSHALGPSLARLPSDNNEDWQYFYVNMCTDRDIFMRFLGGGIGHHSMGIEPEGEDDELEEEDADNELETPEPASKDSNNEHGTFHLDYNVENPTEEDYSQDEVISNGEALEDELEDYEYIRELEPEENQDDHEEPLGELEDDLGPEDGEDYDSVMNSDIEYDED